MRHTTETGGGGEIAYRTEGAGSPTAAESQVEDRREGKTHEGKTG